MGKCNLCGTDRSRLISIVTKKPAQETDYSISPDKYYREIHLCLNCNAYYNFYDYSLLREDFYTGFYNNSIESGKLKDRFTKITSLPFDKSDNKHRAERVWDFIKDFFGSNCTEISLLDVGTGTGVFLFEMEKFLTNLYCVDPDQNSIHLVRECVNLTSSWVGTITDIPKNELFDIITYNKVLEHVHSPISLLRESGKYLRDGGCFYIELPYGDKIVTSNSQEERAEFFIEHLTVYNRASMEYLLTQCDLTPLKIETIDEPSGKQTIYAFAKAI